MPSAQESEALALVAALNWAEAMGFHHVIFEVDSKINADAIHLVNRCKRILLQHTDYSIRFVRRQANGTAHVLAKESRFRSCPTFYFDAPSFLIPVLNIYPVEAH